METLHNYKNILKCINKSKADYLLRAVENLQRIGNNKFFKKPFFIIYFL